MGTDDKSYYTKEAVKQRIRDRLKKPALPTVGAPPEYLGRLRQAALRYRVPKLPRI